MSDLTGRKFGRLTVISSAPRANRERAWACSCECGGSRNARHSMLVHGKLKSCGCLNAERSASTRGLSRTPEYHAWNHMRSRCLNPTDISYKYYGGRGISVCAAWDDFSVFLLDMGPRPSPQHSLDRIDNSGNYERANCRWTTLKEQSRNKRTTVLLTHAGRTMCMKDWSETAGISYDCLKYRLKSGQPLDVALTKPPRIRKVKTP